MPNCDASLKASCVAALSKRISCLPHSFRSKRPVFSCLFGRWGADWIVKRLEAMRLPNVTLPTTFGGLACAQFIACSPISNAHFDSFQRRVNGSPPDAHRAVGASGGDALAVGENLEPGRLDALDGPPLGEGVPDFLS